MKKIRLILAILKTKNYIVITDHLNDGHVVPESMEVYLDILTQSKERLSLGYNAYLRDYVGLNREQRRKVDVKNAKK